MKILKFCFCILCFGVSACQPSAQKEPLKQPKSAVKTPVVDKEKAPVVDNEEDRIVNLIMDLDEVKRKDSIVVKLSKGKRRLSTYVEAIPTATDPYYWVKVAEDNGGSYVTYYSFAVHPKTYQVSYYDVTQDSLITIDQWRKTTPAEER